MTAAKGALDGVRAIDLTRVLGGPFCTQMLGDHGADIIKVEPPQGDETRDWGPPFKDGTASYFIGVNRNKRGLALDLTKAEGRDVLLRLLATADVLIHNYKVGTLEKWGIGYDVLAARFPRLIYCHVTGFGPDGPLGGLPGYDAAVQATTGLLSVNGTEESGPTRLGVPVVDLGAGYNAMVGILLALIERGRTGKGQAIDIALYDSGIGLLHPQAANWFLSHKTPKRIGNQHPNIAPYDCFPTAGRAIFLAVGNDRQFQRLCAELGRPDLADDPRFKTNPTRTQHRPELRAALEGLLANRDGAKLAERLLKIGVPCGAVLEMPDVLAAPHTLHRRMAVKADGYEGFGAPVKMSLNTASVRRLPPKFNEHAAEILGEAGYGAAEIAALTASGVVVAERRKGGGE